ncbi:MULTISPECIES: carbon starvation CstA family protein [Nocardioides]|uniref:Carbon starvation CstA family protein n=1 Tax=Nocardioides vastitatis TaxID=2568655 RepID=A0ABW0ZHH3_9ACTN|nr:carbon starvation CstA family protein [Nocardioides sp.]
MLALSRGEQVSALWVLFAALASYAIAYRFYARLIAYRVLEADDTRATSGLTPMLTAGQRVTCPRRST